TVTYLLDGHMLHEDHLGHRGDLVSGAVHWMTAGRGIIHSEMPQQEHGRMRGFQLWINLPAKEKMKPATYRDIQPAEIPVVDLPGDGHVKVIAGAFVQGGRSTPGPIRGLTTDPSYFDVELPAGASFSHAIEAGYSVFAYPYEGTLQIGERTLNAHDAGVLGAGDRIQLTAGQDSARFLLLAGRPLREPIAQYGPFVMNTREELEQAVRDYQSGELTRAA
ncbi:MAG: pirin family protein, partial [Burkholderiales bacterium]